MINTKFIKMKDMTSTMVLVGMMCLSTPINASATINNVKMNNEISRENFNNHGNISATINNIKMNNKAPRENFNNCGNTSTIINNYEVPKTSFNVQKEAEQIFGEMREATTEEELMVKNYIDSISEFTGVNFWD